jgi:hypothetical protein
MSEELEIVRRLLDTYPDSPKAAADLLGPAGPYPGP